MSKPILELQNSSKWDRLWDYSITVAPAPNQPGYTLEIPPIVLPFQLENHIIAISTRSTAAKPSWKLGGRIAKKIQTGITIGGVPDVTIGDTRKLWLNQFMHDRWSFRWLSKSGTPKERVLQASIYRRKQRSSQ